MNAKLQKNKELTLEAVEKGVCTLKHVPKQLRGDREIVSCAVKRDGLMLEYASPELRNDPEIVSAAISNVGAAPLLLVSTFASSA